MKYKIKFLKDTGEIEYIVYNFCFIKNNWIIFVKYNVVYRAYNLSNYCILQKYVYNKYKCRWIKCF